MAEKSNFRKALMLASTLAYAATGPGCVSEPIKENSYSSTRAQYKTLDIPNQVYSSNEDVPRIPESILEKHPELRGVNIVISEIGEGKYSSNPKANLSQKEMKDIRKSWEEWFLKNLKSPGR